MMRNILLLLILFPIISGCNNTIERLKRVGKEPEFANLEIPVVEESQEELERHYSQLEEQRERMRKTNSLWQPGSTKFFRDSRAWRVGDIIRISVEIKDNATLNNTTQQKRSGDDSMGITNLFGKEKAIAKTLSSKGDPASLVSAKGSHNHNGSGNITRTEDIKTDIAAIVTKVLPNGNLVIHGRQEVRVNHELREIKVAGIIRPKDISSSNSIHSNQIAEARISYGGRGVVSDMQQPKVGSQVIEAISPF